MVMKKFYFILVAAVSVALTSCMNDDFVGDSSGTKEATDAINFGFDFQKYTRGDIAGQDAAKLLGNNFYVTGTKGTEAATSPSPNLVFDNYLVNYAANTAGTTASNTANWEYVGVTPDGTNYVKLGSYTSQTIKYWDFSADQYDFLAFSTGTFKAANGASTGDGVIGVTAMKYGTNLASSATAYTFDLPSIAALKDAYISDITEVKQANFGKEVTLKFKNLGSKVRVALYETIPGYSVQAESIEFYTEDGDKASLGTDAKGTPAALISTDESSFASKGQIKVYFPNVGTNNESNGNYDKAAATVSAVNGDTKKTFGNLASDKKAVAEDGEPAGSLYLGRSLPYATFAGDKNKDYYETVFPVSTGYPLTLRVNYTLISTDGSDETITVHGAKAVVPSTYTVWQPNYAYTYIFKITDATNGWTNPDVSITTPDEGLFPITFDAVVIEATDVTGEQTTITTVATPSITTYQQKHDPIYTSAEEPGTDEYSIATDKNIYVQVMDNNLTPAVLVGTGSSTLFKLNTQTSDATPTNRSLLYEVAPSTTEAKVMDALQNQSNVSSGVITGRNGLVITPNTNINNAVTKIKNGVDDNEITVAAGEAAEIAIASLTAGTYAYVYDYTPAAKVTTDIYQPIVPGATAIGANGKYSVAVGDLRTWDDGTTAAHYSTAGAPNKAYIYFSVTTNGTSTKTFSFVSVDGKDEIPAGLLAYPVASLAEVADNTAAPDANTIYFDKYTRNNGKYAVKVIKVVD